MSTPDLWATSDYDWRKPVVLPTLPVRWPMRDRTMAPVLPDKERRDRLAFAIRAAMGGRSAQDVASVIQPKRSKETIGRWARGETVPSALDIAPLAQALGVRIELLIDPPPIPTYPLSEYLVEQAVQAAVERGRRRAHRPQADEAPSEPEPSRLRSSR
jgi:transcriptional regulator with XRE-family HTH domain